MNKIILSLTAALLMLVMPAKAADYEDIREYALFLTDKMAYELNLSEEQYEAAYEINFDYLTDVFRYERFDEYDDLYGRAWSLRNRDLRIILLDAQYSMFERLMYFYRPFQWSHGRISIQIYNYYPRRDYLYFGCPDFVVTYRGGHGWRHHRHRSYYSGRAWHRHDCYGMRDGYRDGRRYYHNASNNHGWRSDGRHNDRGWHIDGHHDSHHDLHRGSCRPDNLRDSGFGFRNSRSRVSSTRTTVNNGSSSGFGSSRSNVSRSDRRLPDNRFSPRQVDKADRSNGSGLRRDNGSSVSRGSRSNVSRSNRSDKSRSRNNDSNNSRNGGFGGGR